MSVEEQEAVPAELSAREVEAEELPPIEAVTAELPVEADEPVATAEAALEPDVEAAATAPQPEIEAAATAIEADPAVEVEAAAPEPAIEATPQPAIETPPEPEPEPLAAATAADVVEQPTWRITAPDATGTPPTVPQPEPGGGVPLQASATYTALPTGEPQWPARSEWPTSTPAAGLPFLGRPATPKGGINALWAASNQELVTAPPAAGRAASGIQPCVSCGLSLSATARFCRRCGTSQSR